MKRAAFILGSSIVGVVVCLALVWLSQASGLSVRFPSPGGEDDFSLRALYFLFGVCPAFLLLGAWIGHKSFGSSLTGGAMWGGALIGAVVVFIGARLFQSKIAMLLDDGSANQAVLVFYISWIVMSVVGALAAQRLS